MCKIFTTSLFNIWQITCSQLIFIFIAIFTYYSHIIPICQVFQDIGDEYLVSSDNIERGAFLGKGAFGAVFSGTIVHQRSGDHVEVAMKMLQPVNPGPKAGATLLQQYQVTSSGSTCMCLCCAGTGFIGYVEVLCVILELFWKWMVVGGGVLEKRVICLLVSLYSITFNDLQLYISMLISDGEATLGQGPDEERM